MKKGELSEKQIENQVLTWLKFKNIFAFKVKSVGTFDPKLQKFRKPSPWYKRGCPDVVCIHRGKFIGLEIKTKKGRVSPHQELFHKEAKEAGAEIFIVRDVEQLRPIFLMLEGAGYDKVPVL
jgi:hypothetical protein